MSSQDEVESRPWLHNQINGAIAFIVLTVSLVVLRVVGVTLLERHKKRAMFLSWESVLLMASLVFFIPLCACAIVVAQGYFASFTIMNQAEMIQKYELTLKASYGFAVVYPTACALPKLSICCLYLGLFRAHQHMLWATKALMAFLVVNAISWTVPSIVVCNPISAYWKIDSYGAYCINYNVMGTWISLPNIISDLIILSLPLPVLWAMQMQLSKKVLVSITFLAGSIGIIGGALRLGFYIHRTYYERPDTSQSTKSIAVEFIVSYLEAGMYLIAACLPRLRALVTWLQTTVSTSFSSLLARRRSSAGVLPLVDTPSEHSPQGRLNPKNGRAVEIINMKLTGVGKLETLARDLR